MHRLDPQQLWMHAEDAAVRGLKDGQMVLVRNDRGQIRIPVKVTDRIMPGVTALSQGAWYRPDETGTDLGRLHQCADFSASDTVCKGQPQHTNLVEVEGL